MKYIRTKDGKIYDSLALKVDEFVYLDEKGLSHREYKVKDITKSILKIANTIEELCDELVAIRGDCKCLYKQSDIFDCQDKNAVNDLIKNNQIYGAIWTDKGLIYVAKMKGVLPNGEIDWELL